MQQFINPAPEAAMYRLWHRWALSYWWQRRPVECLRLSRRMVGVVLKTSEVR